MNPAYFSVTAVASAFGIGLGAVGFMDGMPMLAGSGFAITVGLQLWTTIQLGPIRVRLAVIEEKISRLERSESESPRRRRSFDHQTPPLEE